MILWISGAYGVGKSTLAEALRPQLPGALIFNAEEVGNAVRENYPDCPYGYIFEDYPLWADFCVALLTDLHTHFSQNILVPMTLLRESSHPRLIGRLRDAGIDARLLVLEASYTSVHDRILARGEDENCWCMENAPLAIAGAAALPADLRIDTDDRSIESIAAEVLTWMDTI